MAPKSNTAKVTLPLAVVGKTEVLHLIQEIDALDTFFAQAKIRSAGSAVVPPKLSQLLEELAKQNDVNLIQEESRKILKAGLEHIIAHAPTVHISFATTPSQRFLSKVTAWFRKEIHSDTLLQVGLQPSIAAGCMVRTTNKFFDLSLRRFLTGQTEKLASEFSGAKHG
ncbi:hypothetical protein KC963_01695 [Candidatus Saccharibacteria bacterium]|nr:hypothetical protein [Candidatus Saccharibacteria bacterium]MCA9337406.1 hypothetical protein [Candidatus Saccharibacteria bacterium]